jgi:hypothetical protein
MAGTIAGINALWLVAVSYAWCRGKQYVYCFLEHPHFSPSYPPGWSHFEKPLKKLWQALTAKSNGVTPLSLFHHGASQYQKKDFVFDNEEEHELQQNFSLNIH